MQYIVHKRFKGKGIGGEMNLPVFTVCQEENGMISYDGKAICVNTSENAHQYFARDNDGKGFLRGKLTQAIQQKLSKRDDNYQTRWDKIWEDPMCQKFKKKEHGDYWLWNHAFFHAEIEELQYIADLIGVKVSNS